MNTSDVETRLKQAATAVTPPRSIVDDVMRRISVSPPKHALRSFWRRPILAAGIASLTGVAAVIALVLFLTGPSVSLALADVQAAVERQAWVHVRYDAGQIAEDWTNLQTGESYVKRFDGSAVYINDQSNTRLWHWKDSGVIDQDTPTIYKNGASPPKWSPHTAWEEFVAPLAHAAATTRPAGSLGSPVSSARDTLNGAAVVRFDAYSTDALGHQFLYFQLWADPNTHLPMRSRTRLQLGEGTENGKEWGTGDYDFPQTGPADLYALDVPRGTPIHRQATTAPDAVRPILEAINLNHDHFLKNYRAIILSMGEQRKMPGTVNIIWRDGDNVREDIHRTDVAVKHKPEEVFPMPFTSSTILAWAAKHQASSQQLMDSQHEYSKRSERAGATTRPQVHVMRRNRFPLLATQSWPEELQWPTVNSVPDFILLEANADTPAGCLGLRWQMGGGGRTDYYVDPNNDYVCVKLVRWEKRGAEWFKGSEEILSGLHRVGGRVVACERKVHVFDNPVRHFYDYTDTTTIDLVPVTAADYPAGTFNPASLTEGAEVIGY